MRSSGVFVSAHVFLCVRRLGGPPPIGNLSCQTPRTHVHTHAHIQAGCRARPVKRTLGIWLLSGKRTQKAERETKEGNTHAREKPEV